MTESCRKCSSSLLSGCKKQNLHRSQPIAPTYNASLSTKLTYQMTLQTIAYQSLSLDDQETPGHPCAATAIPRGSYWSIEKMKKSATKKVLFCRKCSYFKRLKCFGIPISDVKVSLCGIDGEWGYESYDWDLQNFAWHWQLDDSVVSSGLFKCNFSATKENHLLL